MLLDTSILVELAGGQPTDPVVQRIQKALGNSMLFVSPIHLGELADAARRIGFDSKVAVERVLATTDLVALDAQIAVAGSAIKAEARKRKSGRDFSLIDGIGLATARSRRMPMLTMDKEFEGFPDVTIISRKA